MAINSIADLRSNAPRELRNLPDDELIREYSKRKNIPYESVVSYLKPQTSAGTKSTISTLSDLRSTAPQELRSLSDEELIRAYSTRKKIPYDDVANYFGVTPRGTLSQIGTSIAKGVDVGLRRMAGQAIEWGAENLAPRMEELSSIATSGLPKDRPTLRPPGEFQSGLAATGRSMQQTAKEREKKYLPADVRDKNYLQKGMIEAGESLPAFATTVGTAIVNPVAGAGLAYGLYGYSSAKETYDKLISEGVSDEDARAAANRVELLQGGGETVMNLLGARIFKPLGKAFGTGTAATTGALAQQLADTSILKPFAKAYLTALITEPVTEVIQDVGTAAIEEAYGGKKQDLMAIAEQSARAAIGMTVLLGPFALGAHTMRSRAAQEVKAALADDPSISPERRAQILQSVAADARKQGIKPEDIDKWVESQVAMADRDNVALGTMEEAAKNNYVEQFEAAYNAPSGRFVEETDQSGKKVRRELNMGEYLLQEAEARNADAEKDILARKDRSPAQVLADIRASANDPLSPSVWRFPVSTGLQGQQRGMFAGGPEALTTPRPTVDILGGGRLTSLEEGAPLGARQLFAARGPIDETAPRPAMGLDGAQQMAAGGPSALASANLPVSQIGQADIERLRAAAAQPPTPGPSLEQPARLPGLFRTQPTGNIPSALVAPSGGTPATVSPSAPAAPGVFSTASTIASQWDRSNRNSRSQEWMAGAAESNPAFNAVEQEGANVPAHGMAKAATLGQAVKDLVSLLSGGIDSKRTFYYDSLTSPTRGAGAVTGTAGGVAYRDGPFIITFREGLNGRQPTSADITGVLVNPANKELVAPLQKMFPNLVIRDYNKVSDVVAASRVNTAAKPAKVTAPKKTAMARSIEQALEEELDLADTASDAARVNSILNEVNKEKLEAEVQGAKQIKAPGRVSLSQRSLLGIRDAIFRKSGKVAKAFGRNEQKIVDAVRRFTNAYDAYLNFSTNLSREVKKGIAAKADERMAKMDDLAKEVQNALFALGQSMDNNAKNVEAVVRVVKDAAQRKLAKPGKTKKETLDAIESLDSVFSSGWAAAKRESFMKELPDLADVSGQQIRPSTEKQEKGETISAVEDAAKNGYSNPKYDYGKRYTGLAGILQYLRFNTTPMGRVLSKALRDALVESENPAKVVFTDKGGSRYDPKTNTVYINRGEQSAEVVLHETFHAALQWFVYQNPDLPAVKQLQLSLERALAAKGLEGKALEVQVILQELVNKKRGLDAVLELVSYTATLNDFRRAMQEIKTGDAPKSFLESVRSVWAMYKAIVRRMLGVNDTVASDVLSASMDLLEESRSSKYTIPEKLTGKVLDIATTAFKRWFGDSKVVDENGQPLVVYHGTNRSFTAFAKEVLGKATGAPSAKLGFFFAGDPSTSDKYAKNAVRSSRLDSTVIDTYKDMLEKKKAELSEAGFQKAVKSQLRVLNNLYEEEKAQASDAGYNRYLKSRGESTLAPVPKDAYIKERERSAKYYEGRITELENNPESYREEHNKVVNSEISALQNILDKEIEAQGEEQKFGEPAGPNIVPVYLSIKNPMIIDQKGEQYRIMSYYDTVKKAQSLGHDGVIIKNTYDGKLPPGWVTRLVSKWRNEPVPSDTIYIAFEPNQIKSVFNQAPTEAPGILEAKVQSGKQKVTPGTSIPSSPEAAASGQNIMMSKTQLSNYTKTLLPRFTLTETLFNQLGWQDWIKYADRKWITPFNKFIQKETPNLSQAVSWFNSHYGLESNIVEMLVGMKDARRGGTAVSEKVAKYIADMPVSKSKELLSYMNDRLDYLRGIRKEPKFSGDDTYMKRLADQAIDNWWKYATEGAMSSKDRTIFAGTKVGNRWVGGLKFTEGFVFPESVSQVASASFGSRNMRELKSRRTKDEVGTDNIRFRVTVDGDPILTDKFVGIYNDTPQLRARLQAGESLSNIMPDEFISAELFTQSTPLDDKGQAMLHDPAFTWDLQKKGKTGFRFSAHYDAREAYSAKKAIDVANAFQNTMTLLANSYASNTFAKSLYDFGTTKVGSDVIRDGSAVVFDDIDQLNEAINGEGEGANFKPQKDRKKWSYEIKPDKIIRISSDEARSERTKGMFRNRNQWVMVPKGKDGEVYGALSGKIVSGSVWAAIQDASDRRPVVSIPYAADIMRFFKSVKTKYLPATWATNVATNVVFSIADDIPLSTIPHAARLYLAASMNKEMRQKLRIDLSPAEEELMVKILNSNALLGTFASDEIKKGIYEALSANLNGPERNIASRIMQMAGVDKARIETIEKLASTAKDKAVAFDNYATEWYAAQDNIFRVASVLNYLGKAADAGMEINESVVYRAGKHARQAFLDYDIDAKAIRIMRQTAFPFISFPYAATKLLGRLVVNSPWKLVNIYAAAMIMDMMLASMADDDDDETRRTGPEKYRERLLGGFGPHAYFRIPFMGDSDNPVYYHVGKYLFPSSLMDTSPNGFMGISWFPSAISPGGPYVNTILATVAGVDAFNGKPLSDSVATDYEKVIDRLTYLQSMMTPNLPLINIKETQKFADIASGRTDLPKGSTSLALARYMGLRIYNYNVDAELEKQDQAVKGIEADYKKAISKLRKKTERMEEPDWDAFYEKEDELLERMEKRIAELRGEEE